VDAILIGEIVLSASLAEFHGDGRKLVFAKVRLAIAGVGQQFPYSFVAVDLSGKTLPSRATNPKEMEDEQ
jgi:hypothetical protein